MLCFLKSNFSLYQRWIELTRMMLTFTGKLDIMVGPNLSYCRASFIIFENILPIYLFIYLTLSQEVLGDVLAKALSAVAKERPEDPVQFVAEYLYRARLREKDPKRFQEEERKIRELETRRLEEVRKRREENERRKKKNSLNQSKR